MLKVLFFSVISTAAICLNGLQVKGQEVPHWKIDTAQSHINFSVKHVFLTVKGEFERFEGQIDFHPEHSSKSKAQLSIDVSSVQTNNKDRDRHLQSADFFNAEQFPNIKFVSSHIEKRQDNEFEVYGNLTIRDVTREINFPLIVTEIAEIQQDGSKVQLSLDINTSVKRNDYGVGRGNWASTAAIGDNVQISINMVLEGDRKYVEGHL